MSPEIARLWVGVFRDLAIVLTAIFLAVFETVAVNEPSPLILALAGTLFGVPFAIHADGILKRGGKGKEGSDDDSPS